MLVRTPRIAHPNDGRREWFLREGDAVVRAIINEQQQIDFPSVEARRCDASTRPPHGRHAFDIGGEIGATVRAFTIDNDWAHAEFGVFIEEPADLLAGPPETAFAAFGEAEVLVGDDAEMKR